ncbi:plexin-B2-like [Pecten maximus]|uniref:plexin-B2-like n=1 Tax=Pecten maximus TaxID=6579 RepID=UPI001458523E|nr:plexin-B2-like [Pecten maximus]
MECSWLRTTLVAFILYIECVCSMKTFYPKNTTTVLRKIAVDSTGRNLYVGGINMLYHLNADMTEEIGVVQTGPQKDSKTCLRDNVNDGKSTCDIKLYDDYIQLLQVYESGGVLITCGTLSLGKCVGRDLHNISNVNYTSDAYVFVNTEETDSTESVIATVETQSILFVGKSYVETTDYLEQTHEGVKNLIDGVQLEGDDFLRSFETNSGQRPFLIRRKKNTLSKYASFVKGVFYMNNSNSVYTLLQIKTKTTQMSVSKISKICANNTGTHNSYEDFPINCTGFPYVQGGTVIKHEQGEVLVTLFSSTEYITETTPCAVCVYTEDELLEGFRESRIRPPVCDNEMAYQVDYLEMTQGSEDLSKLFSSGKKI